MDKLHKLFFNTEMTWKRVILISVITGIAIGLIMIPDFLDDTSFQDPGVTVEFWVLWALLIILNCQRPREAGLKTFIAFLISQPIIYLVQVPFSWRGWDIFSYYKPWFIMTLLTLPGGMIAWYAKKGDKLSVAVLSVANGIFCGMIPTYFSMCVERFPHHLLTVIFIFSEIIFLAWLLFEDKRLRRVVLIIALALLIIMSIVTAINADSVTSLVLSTEGSGPYTLVSESDLYTVEFDEPFLRINYKPSDIKDAGTDILVYIDSTGVTHEIPLIFTDGSISETE